MRFNILTSMLSVAAIVAGAALPLTISGLAIRRRVEEAPVDLWRRGYRSVQLGMDHFEIEESPTLNPLVFKARSDSLPPLIALKYPQLGHYNLIALFSCGLKVRNHGSADGANWVIADSPPLDYNFFHRTPEYQALLKEHQTARSLPLPLNPVFQDHVNQLIDEAADYVVRRVTQSAHGEYIEHGRLNDFLFNFKGREKVAVIWLSIPPGANVRKTPAELRLQYKRQFEADLKDRIQKDT